MFARGRGVPQDYHEAMKWYRLAAEAGDAAGEYNLGYMYDEGHGVTPDPAEALKWYRLAADKGYATAQSNLGLMYAMGRGVPRDDAEAVRCFRRAAEAGLGAAQFNLAGMYFKGNGVPQDPVLAYMWCDLAVAHADGAEKSTKYAAGRDQIGARLNPAQLAQAQRLAREWKPKASAPAGAEHRP